MLLCPSTSQQLTTSQLSISLFMFVQINNTSNTVLLFLQAGKVTETLQLNVLLIVRHCRQQGGGVLTPRLIHFHVVYYLYTQYK